jgi:hypothetical protein
MRKASPIMLILVSSIWAVASAADPALESATQSQREFAAAYALLANMKVNIARSYATSGRFPPTYLEANLDGPVKGPHFAIELGTEGVLKITFNESAQPDLAGTEYAAVPTVNEHKDIVWYCLAPTIPRNVSLQRCL